MKILQLIDSLQSGGSERMCVNITNVLHEHGHEVTLCSTCEGGPLESFVTPGVRYHILHKKHSADLTAFRRLIRIIRKNDITVIHAHSSSIFWAVAAKICVKHIKVIWHDHLGDRINDKRRNFFYRLLSYKTDAIICVNKILADWARSKMNVPQSKILVINNFPLLNIVRRQSDPAVFTILCLANLRPQKDHETLVRAVALLAKRNLPKKLRVIFAGSDDDSDYSRRIRYLILDLGLENIIELAGSIEDTTSLLAGADCGVLSSVSEGLPVALLEYGLAALPVVVTDVGQCADVAGHGRYARVVSSGNAGEQADALLWVIKNSSEAYKLGKGLRKHVIKEYGPKKFIRDYTELLKMITL